MVLVFGRVYFWSAWGEDVWIFLSLDVFENFFFLEGFEFLLKKFYFVFYVLVWK